MPSRENALWSWGRALRFLILTFVFPITGGSAQLVWAQAATLGEGSPVRNEAADMECVSYCSVTRPGTPLMEVKWKLAPQQLATSALEAKSARQGLEATVYAEGFERGQYVVVSAVKPQALFHAFSKTGHAPTPPKKLPGLENLKVTEVATRATKSVRSFHLLRPETQTEGAAPAEWMAVRVEGIDPGMLYTYRVSGGSSTVACHAVVCPLDRVEAPSAPKSKTPTKSKTPPTPK